jgi:hypothetical protein
MKSPKTIRLVLTALSPPGLYGIYSLSVLILGSPYFATPMSILIYASILVQGCCVIWEVTYLFIQNVLVKHPTDPPSHKGMTVCFISQLVCWPLFFYTAVT